MAGTAAGLAAVVGVLGFGLALDRLIDSPQRYGWGWDVNVGEDDEDLVQALARIRDVQAVAVGRFQVSVLVEGRPLQALGIRNVTGDIHTTIVEGHAAPCA